MKRFAVLLLIPAFLFLFTACRGDQNSKLTALFEEKDQLVETHTPAIDAIMKKLGLSYDEFYLVTDNDEEILIFTLVDENEEWYFVAVDSKDGVVTNVVDFQAKKEIYRNEEKDIQIMGNQRIKDHLEQDTPPKN